MRTRPWRRAIAALVLAASIPAAPTTPIAGAAQRRAGDAKVVKAERTAGPDAETIPFRLVAGRIVVNAVFAKVDGTAREALVWINMGTPTMALEPSLASDIGARHGTSLDMNLGAQKIDIPGTAIEVGTPEVDGEDVLAHLFAPLAVEAILPASVLQHYRLVLDFPARRIGLLSPAMLDPTDAVATPFELAPETGLIAVDVEIAGEPHRLAIDAGASATWLRGNLVRRWLAVHPDWLRADGAVGASNMGLTSLGLERHGQLVRLPDTRVADRLVLPEIAAFGTAPLLCDLCDRMVGDLFWDTWQRNAPAPVAGWLGNDVLGDFRLVVDYPRRTLFWQRRRPQGRRDILQVGITLMRRRGEVFVAGLVAKDGRATVTSLEDGDRLLAIDGNPVAGQSTDAVLAALSGAAGARHVLEVERDGRVLEAETTVSVF